jgi:hypothetical protein
VSARPAAPFGTMAFQERFWSKAMVSESLMMCWPWTGPLSPKGYGSFAVAARPHVASRVAYELAVAPVPAGLELDHLCRNPACVNPYHLEPVTHWENMARARPFVDPLKYGAWLKNRTSCKNGHEFTPGNTWTRHSRGRSHRVCKECRKLNMRRYVREKRA